MKSIIFLILMPLSCFAQRFDIGDTVFVNTGSEAAGEYSYVFAGEKMTKKYTAGPEIDHSIMIIESIHRRPDRPGNDGFIVVAKRNGSEYRILLPNAMDEGEVNIRFRNVYPYATKTTLWITPNVKIHEGSVVKLGKGSLPNGDYKFVSVERGKGHLITNRDITVRKINVRGSERIGYKYETILAGDYKDYLCDAWNALESGELLLDGYKPNNSSNTASIADELKKLKELKDQGVLTDEEFQAQKQKLLNK